MSSAYNHKKRSHRSHRQHPGGHKVRYITPGFGRRRGLMAQVIRAIIGKMLGLRRNGRGGKYGGGE